jgi:hypothetical protein
VVISLSGAASVSVCDGSLNGTVSLTETQLETLYGWVDAFAPVQSAAQSDPAMLEGFSQTLTINGNGAKQLDDQSMIAIGNFAADLEAQVAFNTNVPAEEAQAAQRLGDYFTALHAADYVTAAKYYGGDTSLLQTWNPDISNDLPKWFERACTQNGLKCLLPRTITYRGPDAQGGFQFFVEFSNDDGSFFRQGPCCGETEGSVTSAYLFRVLQTPNGYVVMDLPPYVP